MKLKVYVSTNVGNLRGNNEDNYFAGEGYSNPEAENDKTLFFETDSSKSRVYSVCDGMGGESCGEVASGCAVRLLSEYSSKIEKAENTDEQKKQVRKYVSDANNQIVDEIIKAGGLRGGTTLTLACILEDRISMYYLGDSRIYMLRDGIMTRITRDHTVAYEKVDANIYTEEEAEKSPDAHKLTMFLGVDDEKIGLNAEYAGTYSLKPGDFYLMCSDGLTDMCTDKEISDVLDMECENFAKELVTTALINGGEDNVTCLVIEVC